MVYVVLRMQSHAMQMIPTTCAEQTLNMVGTHNSWIRVNLSFFLFYTYHLYKGQTCPLSHPIPCAGGSKCTAKPVTQDRSRCSRCDMFDTCCPDDAIDCNDSESGYLCLGNPQYGIYNLASILHTTKDNGTSYNRILMPNFTSLCLCHGIQVFKCSMETHICWHWLWWR